MVNSIDGRQREGIVARIKEMLKDRTLSCEKYETNDRANNIYALWAFGQYDKLQQHLDMAQIASEFWNHIEHFSPRINKHFNSPDLGEWKELPSDIVQECKLLPGDFLVIKQQQAALWEWHHAGMVKNSEMLYSAMYPLNAIEQPIDYYRRHATHIRAFRIHANHAQPELGRQACAVAAARVGNTYGISDKWFALQHVQAPMYCSLVPWLAWIQVCGLNLDAQCPDYTAEKTQQKRLQQLCRIPHSIVYPTGLAISHTDRPKLGFAAKTDCVLDMVRPGESE